MSGSENSSLPLPARPSIVDRDAWRIYWQQLGQPWRTEPEINEERQKYLAERRETAPDIEKGNYPFKDIKLSRVDVEWLLATHEHGRGPVDWASQKEREKAWILEVLIYKVSISAACHSRVQNSDCQPESGVTKLDYKKHLTTAPCFSHCCLSRLHSSRGRFSALVYQALHPLNLEDFPKLFLLCHVERNGTRDIWYQYGPIGSMLRSRLHQNG